MRKKVSRIATLEFQRANFQLPRQLVSCVPLGICWSRFRGPWELVAFQEPSFNSPGAGNPTYQAKGVECKPGCTELLLELGQNKKIHELWKHGLASYSEYRAAVYICNGKTRKAKKQFEFVLASVVPGNKSSFSKYVNSKGRSNENTALILTEMVN